MPARKLRALLCLLLLCLPMPAMPQQAGLPLEEAYSLARKSSVAVRLRELALQKSRLSLSEAQSRAWPRLDLQASASYLVNPPTGYTVAAGELGSFTPTIPAGKIGNPTPVPLGTFTIPPRDFTIGAQQHNYFSFAASFSQPLFTWGKIRNAIDLASLQADTAGADLAFQQRDIDREVHRAYFGALLAQRSGEILRRIRSIAAEMLADREKALEQGTITRLAVLEARSTLAAFEAKLAEAGQAVATSLESLGILTGLGAADLVLSTDFLAAPPQLDEESVRATALKESTELAAARTRLLQAQKKLAIERGGAVFRPDLSLAMSLDVTGQEDIPFSGWTMNNDTWNWDLVVSLGVKMSAFDGLASTRRVEQAEKDVEMAGLGLSQQEKLVRLEARRAIEAMVRADAEVTEKEAGAAYAEERLRNAKASLESGAASREDLHGAELLAGSAQLELLLARYTREEALADIERMTGSRL